PPAAVCHHRWVPRRVRGRRADILPSDGRTPGKGEERRVRPLFRMVRAGAVLVVVVGVCGGRPAALGGAVALVAQLAAVAILRPAMTAPQPVFMARWLGGMGIRALAL